MNITSFNIQHNEVACQETPFFNAGMWKGSAASANNGEEYTLKAVHANPSLSKISPLSLCKGNSCKVSPFLLNQEESAQNSKRNSVKEMLFTFNNTQDCIGSFCDDTQLNAKGDKRKSIIECISEGNNESKQEDMESIITIESNIDYEKESQYMYNEMMKLANNDNEHISLCKESDINTSLQNDNEILLSNNVNIFPVDYEFDINETYSDIHICSICFLTIPRIVCRDDKMELIVLAPFGMKSFCILFKHIHSMKITNRIDVNLITACYMNKHNSFGIEFMKRSTFHKEKVFIYTKTNKESVSYVEGLNYLIKKY